MKIQYGSVITGASGSLGGIVAARNANGAYLRRKVKNVNPNTLPQQARRNQFGALSRQWKLLSASQQNGWAIASASFPYKNKLNIASTYTGFQLYCKFNNQLAVITQPFLTDAPVPVPVNALVLDSVAITNTVPSVILFGTDNTTGDSVIPADTTVIVWATGALSSGISKPKKPMFRRVAILIAGDDMEANNVTLGYTAVFGTVPPVGSNCYFELQFVSNLTGQVGNRVGALATIS